MTSIVQTGCLTAADGRVTIERPGVDAWSMPWSGGTIRVVVDGSVVEVSSEDGILGSPIDPTSGWQDPAGPCTGWVLDADR